MGLFNARRRNSPRATGIAEVASVPIIEVTSKSTCQPWGLSMSKRLGARGAVSVAAAVLTVLATSAAAPGATTFSAIDAIAHLVPLQSDLGPDDTTTPPVLSRVVEPVTATTSMGRTVELAALSVDETHAASREGRDLFGLRPGESVSFVLDDTYVQIQALAAGCDTTQSVGNPSVVTAAPSGRAQSRASFTASAGCPSSHVFQNNLIHAKGGEAGTNVTVPPGTTKTQTVGRNCSSTSTSSWKAKMSWGQGLTPTNWVETVSVTLRCTP